MFVCFFPLTFNLILFSEIILIPRKITKKLNIMIAINSSDLVQGP